MSDGAFARRLESHHPRLVAWCRRHGGRVLRFETAEDLAQGAQLAAVARAGGFELRTDEELEAWLFRVARGHLADRRAYWSALKRRSGRLLRITAAPGRSGAETGAVAEPPLAATGPVTFADRREQVVLATRALSLLMSRDQRLVRWYAEGVPIAEQAERLGVGYDAARVAQSRALERFRKSFRFVSG
jgi:RNA polymerase sigma factor (sigma-70 family)